MRVKFSRRGRGVPRVVALAAVSAAMVAATATAALVPGGREPGDRSASVVAAVDPSVPRNVILLIGDSMGEPAIAAARNYAGYDRRLAMDTLPFRGVATTWSVSHLDNSRIDFGTDSAAGATAFTTGRKTIATRLSQGPTTDFFEPGSVEGYETTMEKAARLGKRVGNVTTASLVDATPAAPTAHVSTRGCAGPEDMRSYCPRESKHRGGLGSSAEQQVDHEVDLLLGGGRSSYDQRTDGANGDGTGAGAKSVLDYAVQDRGYRLVEDAVGLDAVRSLDDGKVLGLFAADSMTPEWMGAVAALAPGNKPTPSGRCDESHAATTSPGQPSLAAMTRKSLELLENPKGFFLQVEGAQVDDGDHASNPCHQIGAVLGLDEAVAVALDFQREHPDTLVVVTADHGGSLQISTNTLTPTGYYQTLTTRTGEELQVSYGTGGGRVGQAPEPTTPYQAHTGEPVPVMAIGPQASNVVGVHDMTHLHPLLAFELTPSKLPGGSVVTVPGPERVVPGPETRGPERVVPGAPRLPRPAVVLAATPKLSAASLTARGLPVTVLATRAGRAQIQLRLASGGRLLASARRSVRGSRAARLRLGRGIRVKGPVALRVRVQLTVGGRRVASAARVTVTR